MLDRILGVHFLGDERPKFVWDNWSEFARTARDVMDDRAMGYGVFAQYDQWEGLPIEVVVRERGAGYAAQQ